MENMATGGALIDQHRLDEPHVLLRIIGEDYYISSLDDVLKADAGNPILRQVKLGYGCLTVDHLSHCQVGDVVFFKKIPPNRIQSFRCQIVKEAAESVRHVIDKLSAARENADRIRLSLAEPSTLRIIVPDSCPALIDEMKTGQRVKIQWRDDRDFGGAPIPSGAVVDNLQMQLDVVFEDGTEYPWSFTCNIFDFLEYGRKDIPDCLPRKTRLKRAVVEFDGRHVLTLPAFTDMTFSSLGGNDVAVTSNSIHVNFIHKYGGEQRN